ncbi:CHAT domain-containing protein [Mycena capillaripes]|nr:CHAT domain-containing protein [Mycena capillaripes]
MIPRVQQHLAQMPSGHPNIPRYEQLLGENLMQRYRESGNLNDLETSMRHFQSALHLTSEGDPDRARRIQSLAKSLGERYHRLGDLKDLEAALQTNKQAVDLTPPGDPDRGGQLQSLGMSLMAQYQRLGDLKDLEAAMQAQQEAVDLTPSGHPDRAGQLQNLGISLRARYQRLGDLNDLEAAIHAQQEAVNVTPSGHPHRAGQLQNLRVSLRDRYQRLGDLEDLEVTLQAQQEVVNLTPSGHPDRAGQFQNLGLLLTDRYQRLGDLKDLEAALQAVDLIPSAHPDRAGHLQSLAVSFTDRFHKLGDPKDLEAVRTYYTDSFKLPCSAPEKSWEHALRWADVAQEFQSSDCVPAFQTVFNLLPEILWIGNSVPVRQQALRRLNISGVTSNAVRTCIKLSQLHGAVEILEQGLAVIFQQMLQLKADVGGLPPNQAQIFSHLSSHLYSGIFTDPFSIAIQRAKLLEDIHKQPGFENFLLPKSYDALSNASQGGPVVILTSHEDQCDGIILLTTASDPVHVPLPTVTLELLNSQQELLMDLLDHCNVRNRKQASSSRLFGNAEDLSKSTQKCFEDILNWIWTHVVNPVYQVLQSVSMSTAVCLVKTDILWWLPVGAFAGLPLHASPPTDEFIHSYTATLGSLLDAYAKSSSNPPPKLAVIGVNHADSNSSESLQGVEQEVEKIASIVKEPYHVQHLAGEQATMDAVKLQLQECSWVHLACSGGQNPVEPTKSHLRLYDGNLELETILRMYLPNAQFVFLSAPETAMGDAELVNESFHLVGGFIAAGFQSAIGTMWTMNDTDRPMVAEVVYSHLFREGQQPQASDASKALQLAVQELKNRKVPYERWVPFIHIGV